MSDDKAPQNIIIRRIKKVHNKHHGGSWKIAYADFVTAMMAFFLLMWLLALLNKYQLEGVAQYFKKPLKEAFGHQDDGKKKIGGVDKSEDKKKFEEMQKVKALKAKLETKLNKDPELSQFKNQLNFIITANGLKIELRDLQNKTMFSEGKTDFQNHADKIVSWLSSELNTYPNQVVIIGHTDGSPYANQSKYDNWELSSDRANAARRSLVKHGMGANKIIRVIGVADTELLNKKDVKDPTNRRIEIIVLTDEASKKIAEE